MFGSAIKSRRLDTGALVLVVDRYKIVKLAGVTNKQKWLWDILGDMREAKVEIYDNTTHMTHQGGIVSEFGKSEKYTADGRELWAVTISAAWMRIYDTSLVVRYRNLLPILSRIWSGHVHAMALHVLTHKEGYFDLTEVLKRISAWPDENLKPESFKRQVRRLFEAIEGEEKLLGELGMTLYIEQGKRMLHYVPPVGIGVQQGSPE